MTHLLLRYQALEGERTDSSGYTDLMFDCGRSQGRGVSRNALTGILFSGHLLSSGRKMGQE